MSTAPRASETIEQAVRNLDGHLFEHRRAMDVWLQRFEELTVRNEEAGRAAAPPPVVPPREPVRDATLNEVAALLEERAQVLGDVQGPPSSLAGALRDARYLILHRLAGTPVAPPAIGEIKWQPCGECRAEWSHDGGTHAIWHHTGCSKMPGTPPPAEPPQPSGGARDVGEPPEGSPRYVGRLAILGLEFADRGNLLAAELLIGMKLQEARAQAFHEAAAHCRKVAPFSAAARHRFVEVASVFDALARLTAPASHAGPCGGTGAAGKPGSP